MECAVLRLALSAPVCNETCSAITHGCWLHPETAFIARRPLRMSLQKRNKLEMLPPRIHYTIRWLLNRQMSHLNGQIGRELLLRYLIAEAKPDAIVETGCFHGATTEFFANCTSNPVISIEVNPYYVEMAKLRCRSKSNVSILQGDSGSLLREILQSLPSSCELLLFYLDAHWYDYLPLEDEIRAIRDCSVQCVIVIDDFMVPFDAGYGYDRYGEVVLGPDYLRERGLWDTGELFYPSLPSYVETGARRGCCVIGRGAKVLDMLLGCPLLTKGPS